MQTSSRVGELLGVLRGDTPGESLSDAIRQMYQSVNEARQKAEAQGADDLEILRVMREEWERHPWEVRYAALAGIVSQWFAFTAPHNLDRIGLLERYMAQREALPQIVTDLVLGLPELERAFNHQPEDGAHEVGDDGSFTCECFAMLMHQMKLEPLVLGAETEAPLMMGQKGEA